MSDYVRQQGYKLTYAVFRMRAVVGIDETGE
jgi:hypothetical protein